MKRLTLLIFLTLNLTFSAQNHIKINEDNYFKERHRYLLNKEATNDINIEELNELIIYTLKTDLVKGRYMIKKHISKSKKNLLLEGNLTLRFSNYYFYKGVMDSCKYYLDTTIIIAKKNNFKKLYVNALTESSKYFITKSKRDNAFDSITKAIKYYKTNNLIIDELELKNAKIDVLSHSDSISKSIELGSSIIKSINVNENTHPLRKLNLYFILAKNYGKINDLVNQKKYIDLYFSFAKKTAYPFLYGIYNQKGNYYFKKGELYEALKAINTGYTLAKKSKFEFRAYLFNSNRGTILMYLGKLKEAEKILLESLEYEKKQNLLSNSANSLEDLSRIYYYLDEKNKSELFFKRAIDSAKKVTNNHLLLASFYENKYLDFKQNNNFKDALLYFEKYQNENTTVFEEKFYKQAAESESKYETQEKENQILKLENETQSKELLIQQSKTKTNYAIASIFLVILGGGLYLRKRKKDQKLKILEESIKSSEQEKIRIGKDLHDGIASNLRLLAHDFETKDIEASHKLLDSYTEIRNLSHQLNNTPIHGEVFMDRLYEIVPKNTDNQLFEVQIEPPYLELKEPYSTHLFRISQELFTNNLKYAKASKTSIEISLKDDFLKLNYSDNGIGSSNLKNGNGLKSIEDRVTLLKGDLTIDANSGFIVMISVPYIN